MSDTPTISQPWERQPDESPRAFAAFAQYRDLEPNVRSLSKVAQGLGKSAQLLARWSADHKWVDRVAAFDEWIDKRKTEARAQEKEKAERLAMKSSMVKLRVSYLAGSKRLRMQKRAKHPIMSPQGEARLQEVATKEIRLQHGEATDRVQTTATVMNTNEPTTPEIQEAMLDDEYRRHMLAAAERLAAVAAESSSVRQPAEPARPPEVAVSEAPKPS